MKTLKGRIVILTVIAGMSVFSAQAAEPHMHAALEHLRAARAELQKAEHNKGGWRAKAIQNVDNAIADVQRGMAVGR